MKFQIPQSNMKSPRNWAKGRALNGVPFSSPSSNAGRTFRFGFRYNIFASLRLCVMLAALGALLCPSARGANTNDITSLVQRGLFEEEANHNLDAAMQSYETAIKLHDKDRKLAATAIFRLGECYRKQGKTEEANKEYKRIVTEFPDQKELVDLSRSFLPKGTNSFQTHLAKIGTDASRSDMPELNNLSLETAKAEALWKRVSQFNHSELVKFFITVQPDTMLVDLMNKRQEALAKVEALSQSLGSKNPEYKTAETLLKSTDAQMQRRLEDLVWGVEQKYKMLKEQEDALRVHLGQSSNSVAQAKESPTTSEEDEEIRKIKEMIQNSPDLINARGESGETPLQSAASSGHLKVAEYLIASGADINPTGETPLMFAAQKGHNAVVEFLLSKGAKVDATNREGLTALHYAARHGFKIVVETLLKNGADVNARSYDGATALWYAADNGSKAILELLVAKGADVNAVGGGASPVLQAVRTKHADCVEFLVTHKANVNFTDSNGDTPLLSAAENHDVACAKPLLDHAADTESQIPPHFMTSDDRFVRNYSRAGFRAINIAIERHDPEFVELLLNYHANPNSTFTHYETANSGRAGTTPLIMAVRTEQPTIVEILLNHGADPNGADAQGVSALHYAARSPKTNLAQMLLQHGANVNAFDQNHQTPLFYVINQQSPNTNMIALLIDHHADVNVADKYGEPPFFHVMSEPSGTPLGAVREQLLKGGANENFFRLKQICVSRNGQQQVIFSKGTNDWNRYTLFELLGVIYETRNVAGIPSAGSMPTPALRSIPNRVPDGSGMVGGPPGSATAPDMQFPDLYAVKIHRLMANGKVQEIPVNVAAQLSSQSPEDTPLQWGDVVEIPEQDHAISAAWQGLPQDIAGSLNRALHRQVEIVIQHPPEARQLVILGDNGPHFRLSDAINKANILRSSSDASRIKVTHRNSNRSTVFDLSKAGSPEEPWLKPGDCIEIPDRETTSASNGGVRTP